MTSITERLTKTVLVGNRGAGGKGDVPKEGGKTVSDSTRGHIEIFRNQDTKILITPSMVYNGHLKF